MKQLLLLLIAPLLSLGQSYVGPESVEYSTKNSNYYISINTKSVHLEKVRERG